MVFEFKLPDVGEGVAEGEVVKWLFKEGAEVKEKKPLGEIMTDKVNVEISSPKKGTILKLNAKEGEVVKVGQVLLVIGEKGEQAPTGPPPSTPATPAQVVAKPAEVTRTATVVPAAAPKKPQEILATPSTRKLARDLGVDLAIVQGTGPGGRITDDDVRRFKESGRRQAAVAVTVPTKAGVEERVPLRGIRRKIAEHMLKNERRCNRRSLRHADYQLS